MLIVLPPSEGKTSPARGRPLDLESLSFPALSSTRERVLDALAQLCSGPTERASHVLGLGPTQASEIEANRNVRTRPTAAAISVYTGVLYDSLDYPTLSAPARRRASRTIVIASGVWGLVRPQDRIPAYRLGGGVSLPGLGTLASVWRDPVSNAVGESSGLIVDLRSGTYASLGPVPKSAAGRSVAVRVLLERDGRRGVVSHMNKATKGRLLRAALESGDAPRSTVELMDALASWGFRAEGSTRAGAPDLVDVIVTEV